VKRSGTSVYAFVILREGTMPELRIFRRYTWELDCSPIEVCYGGSNPMKLVAYDELQYRGSGPQKDDWLPVPVVEAEKPLYPHDAQQQDNIRRQSEELRDIFAKAKKVYRAI
jgi:hypothetical protein